MGFLANYRVRRQAEREADRAHQLALVAALARSLEIITEGSAKQAEEQTKAIMALAASSAEQAKAFSTWIASFQVAAPPTTSVVREDDELREEEARLLAEMPEEFRLALQLHHQDFMDDVRKDIRP